MDISYLGHSSFKIHTKGVTVITDPFDPKMVGLKYSGVSGEIVTVSHDHKDHNEVGLVSGVKKIINSPGEYEIMGVSVIGIPSFHDDKGGDLRGRNTMYLFEAEGLRLLHLGDLGHTLSEKDVEEIGHIDVLMIPVGGEYTIGPKEATIVVQDIEAPYIIPMHYQTPSLNTESFSKIMPVEAFISESGLPSKTLPKFQVKKEDLSLELSPEIIILEKK